MPISEWGPTLAKIRQDPPAVIAITHFLPQDLAQFMVQFVAQSDHSLVYMQYGPSMPAFREIAKEASNGVALCDGRRRRCRMRSAQDFEQPLQGEVRRQRRPHSRRPVL